MTVKKGNHSEEVNMQEAATATLPEENPLSEREMEVSRLLVTGATNTEIARELVISPHTVKVHVRNVFEKLQVNSRTEASMVLIQRGWLVVPGIEVSPQELDGDGGDETEADQAAIDEPLPEPVPLVDLPADPLPWQRVYLLGATLICVVALMLPEVLNRPSTPVGLLSDGGQTIVGKPVLETQPRWEPRQPLAQPRSRMADAHVENIIYILGGETMDGETLATVAVYDLVTNRWQTLPSLPEPLANAAAVLLGNSIYVAGGSSHELDDLAATTLSDALYQLDLETLEWTRRATLPTPLAGAQLVASEDALYLLGGWDGETMHDEVWRMEPGDDPSLVARWELVGRLPVAAAFFGAALVENELYVVGGYDGQKDLADAAVYHLTTGIWRPLPPLSVPRSGLEVVYDGLTLLALGGGWTEPVDTHERYDPMTNQWSNFPSPIRGEWRHFSAVNQAGSIHLIGGWGGDYLDTHLQYQSTFRALLPSITND